MRCPSFNGSTRAMQDRRSHAGRGHNRTCFKAGEPCAWQAELHMQCAACKAGYSSSTQAHIVTDPEGAVRLAACMCLGGVIHSALQLIAKSLPLIFLQDSSHGGKIVTFCTGVRSGDTLMSMWCGTGAHSCRGFLAFQATWQRSRPARFLVLPLGYSLPA